MSKKGTSKHKKDMFKAYRDNGTAAKNAVKRLVKHLSKHPNDFQSAERRIPSWPEVKKS